MSSSFFCRVKRKVEQSTAMQLVSVPYMRKFMLVSIFIYSSTMLAYYGTAYNVTRLPGTNHLQYIWNTSNYVYWLYVLGNVYFNSIITGFSEVLGNLITIPVIRFIGLKKTAILFNLIAGISMITTLAMLETDRKRYSWLYLRSLIF